MAICREIKKHYTIWSFLAVMDSSNQYLNQIRFSFPLFYFLCIKFYSTFFPLSNLHLFVGMLQGNLHDTAALFPK